MIEGPMRGTEFLFAEHDTFLLGRLPECHICLPNDKQVSRHHFLIETNPPQARIRDLGSLNGTYINGVKHGGRKRGESPEDGALRHYPEVDLKDGDRIQVGQTVLAVRLESAAVCCECGAAIADADTKKCIWIGDTFICVPCRGRLAAFVGPGKSPNRMRCEKCGRDVPEDRGQCQDGHCICSACRQCSEADPMKLLNQLLAQARTTTPIINGFEIERKIGQGGYGAVYAARREQSQQRVAIKLMLSNVAVDEQSRQKFAQEIEVMKQLQHEHIVTLLEHGSVDLTFYFVMEFCEGGSVAHLMECQGGKLGLVEAGPIFLQSLEGLAYAHQSGFVHRDLKPHNLLLKGSPQAVKIGDFGFTKSFQKAGFSGMTVTGTYAGTPYYMPREQVINFKYVKPVSDVWSLGATFYHILTGHFPRNFRRGLDPIEVVLAGAMTPIRQRDDSIPKKAAEVIDRALANDPKQRFQDALEMHKAMVLAP